MKKISVVLILIIIFSVFTGCGTLDNEKNNLFETEVTVTQESTDTTSNVSEEAETTVADENTEENDYTQETTKTNDFPQKSQDATETITQLQPQDNITQVPSDVPTNPPTNPPTEKTDTVTISIDCKTILDNMDKLNKNKVDIIPSDGIILYRYVVEIDDDDTVFDVLAQACNENKIHMEFSYTPVLDSNYIEGIYNIYELDCGSASGWSYNLNGVYENLGCNRINVKSEDVIEFRYTCALGQDL